MLSATVPLCPLVHACASPPGHTFVQQKSIRRSTAVRCSAADQQSEGARQGLHAVVCKFMMQMCPIMYACRRLCKAMPHLYSVRIRPDRCGIHPACRKVAQLVVQRFIRDQQVIAFGHGSLANSVIEALAAAREQGHLRGIRCLPASDTAAAEAAICGLPMSDPERHSRVRMHAACHCRFPMPCKCHIHQLGF